MGTTVQAAASERVLIMEVQAAGVATASVGLQEAGHQAIAETEMIGITTHQQLFVTIIFVQAIAKTWDKMEAIVRRTNVFASNKSTNPKFKRPQLQAIIQWILLNPNYVYSYNKFKVSNNK